MDKQARLIVVLSVCVMVAMGLLGCGGKNTSPAKPSFPVLLVEKTVTVAGGGGGANVTFDGSSGWSIRITLTATQSTMMPYGYLECQVGTGTYRPPEESAKNGQNSDVVTLAQTGTYTLTIFDGENKGGTVSVKVERLS